MYLVNPFVSMPFVFHLLGLIFLYEKITSIQLLELACSVEWRSSGRFNYLASENNKELGFKVFTNVLTKNWTA